MKLLNIILIVSLATPVMAQEKSTVQVNQPKLTAGNLLFAAGTALTLVHNDMPQNEFVYGSRQVPLEIDVITDKRIVEQIKGLETKVAADAKMGVHNSYALEKANIIASAQRNGLVERIRVMADSGTSIEKQWSSIIPKTSYALGTYHNPQKIEFGHLKPRVTRAKLTSSGRLKLAGLATAAVGLALMISSVSVVELQDNTNPATDSVSDAQSSALN